MLRACLRLTATHTVQIRDLRSRSIALMRTTASVNHRSGGQSSKNMRSLWNMRGAAAKIWLRSGLLLILGLSLYELASGCFAYWAMAHMPSLDSLRHPALAVQDQEG